MSELAAHTTQHTIGSTHPPHTLAAGNKKHSLSLFLCVVCVMCLNLSVLLGHDSQHYLCVSLPCSHIHAVFPPCLPACNKRFTTLPGYVEGKDDFLIYMGKDK